MHNNIIAAGSRDRPPMLATGRYAQWRSRFLRYVDTRPNGDALQKYILEGPYTLTTVIILAVPAMDNSLAVPEQTIVETILNMSPENKDHFESKKETAYEMWEAIERLQQGESLNIQDVKTNLFWEFGQFTSHDGETIESYYTRFYKMMNEMIINNLTVAAIQVNEVNESERMAKNANPLALAATAQTLQDSYCQTSKSHKSYAPTSKASLPSRYHATIRHKGKEIAKPITPLSESASEEDSDPEQAQKDKDMQKNLALITKYKNDNQTGQFGNQRAVNVVGARDTVGGQVVQQSGIQCFNCKEFGHFTKECRKPKRVKDSTYHKEKMLLCKLRKEVPNADSGSDTKPLEHVQYDTENDVFANKIQHFEQSESISNTCVVKTDDSNVIPNSPDMCDNDIQNDQNDVECDDELVALANLIAILKLDVDENKKIQKQLKKANATLTQELTECKYVLTETSRTLGESNSIRDSCLVAL
ncbi:retrovirus-related pol polyprotein from transposon TNT 1-94 [Tanacetum coccineum]